MTRPRKRPLLVAGGLLALTVFVAILVVSSSWFSLYSSADPRPLSAEPSGDSSGNFNLRLSFGFRRQPISRSVLLNLCPPGLPAEQVPYPECSTSSTSPPAQATTPRPEITAAGLIEDLQGTGDAEGNQFPASQVTVSAVNEGEQGIRISVSADPREPEQVAAGEYLGRLVVQRTAGEPVRFDAIANLRDRDDASPWAALALLLGALAGAGVKWLNDSFAPLASLRRRHRRAQRAMRRELAHLPLGASRMVDEISDSIRAVDTAGVSDSLDLLAKHRDELIEFAIVVSQLEDELAIQRALLEGMPSHSADLDDVVRREEARVEALRAKPWPWADRSAVMAECAALEAAFSQATARLREEASSSVGARPEQLAADLRTLADVELDPRASAIVPSRSQEPPTADRNWFEFLLDNSWWILVFISAFAVAAIGYYTEFQNDDGFSGDQSDYLRLAAWAFAIELAGTTVVEAAGRLATTRAGAAPTSG